MENTTKITAEKFAEIVKAVASHREDLFAPGSVDRVWDSIYWAWNNWDADVLASYFTGEKPEKPTQEFINEWVRRELEAVPEQYEQLIESFLK